MLDFDIFQDSLAEADPFASTVDNQNTEENLYWIITSRAKGDANNPFGGSATSNQTSQLVQMTEDQIRQEYQDSGQLQDKFGSFDSYMGYINDSQDFVQSAEWMMANPEYKTGSKEWAFLNGEDLAWNPGEREQIQQKIIQDRIAARTSAFNQWMGSEAGSALMDKYGIKSLIYNDDGDKFKWTGSGYQKTYKVDDSFDTGGFVKGLIVAAATAGVGSVLGAAVAKTAFAKSLGLSQAMSTQIVNTALNVATNQDMSISDGFSFALNSLVPGSGEIVDPDIAGAVGSAIQDYVTNPDNYEENDVGQIVWDTHSGTDEIGNPIINIPDFSLPNQEDGGSASSTDSTNVTDGSGDDTTDTVDGGGATDGGETEVGSEDTFVYDPEHDHIYRGNGVFEQIDENGELTGQVWVDPDFESEDGYSAVIGEGYSVPGSAGDLGSDTSQEGTSDDNDTTGTTAPTEGSVCFLSDGNMGVILNGVCVAPDIGTGTDGTGTDDGVTDGNDETDGTDGGVTDGNDGTGDLADGSICFLSDGNMGVISNGVCVSSNGNGTGDGSGDGGGDGDGDGDSEGMLKAAASGAPLNFKPYDFKGLTYTTPTIQEIIQNPNVDYMASLDNVINQGMFGKYI